MSEIIGYTLDAETIMAAAEQDKRDELVTTDHGIRTVDVAAGTENLHRFERAGLGRAPFRCIDMVERVGPIDLGNGRSTGAPGQPMGCCKFCSTGIKFCYVIQSADGNVFDVGSECVRHTGDKGLVAVVKRHEAEHRKALAEARGRRECARIEVARVAIADDGDLRAKFSGKPHPNKWHADQGDTLADYLCWLLAHAGHTGQLRATKAIEKAQKALAEGGA